MIVIKKEAQCFLSLVSNRRRRHRPPPLSSKNDKTLFSPSSSSSSSSSLLEVITIFFLSISCMVGTASSDYHHFDRTVELMIHRLDNDHKFDKNDIEHSRQHDDQHSKKHDDHLKHDDKDGYDDENSNKRRGKVRQLYRYQNRYNRNNYHHRNNQNGIYKYSSKGGYNYKSSKSVGGNRGGGRRGWGYNYPYYFYGRYNSPYNEDDEETTTSRSRGRGGWYDHYYGRKKYDSNKNNNRCNYQCPDNSHRKPNRYCYDTFDDCECYDGYVKYDGEDECKCPHTTYKCPYFSYEDPSIPCHSSFEDCLCEEGYVKYGEECICPNKESRCPAYSYPNPKISCPKRNSYDHCLCEEGYVKVGDECVCPEYNCPEYSYPNPDVPCPNSVEHCLCDEGYIKYSGDKECTCINNIDNDDYFYSDQVFCPPHSSPDPNIPCPYDIIDHCLCEEGYVKFKDECVCSDDFLCPINSYANPSIPCPRDFNDCFCEYGHERYGAECLRVYDGSGGFQPRMFPGGEQQELAKEELEEMEQEEEEEEVTQDTIHTIITHARNDLIKIFKQQPMLKAKLIRLIFHDCVGGCDGCVDLSSPDNFGLAHPINELKALVAKYVDRNGSGSNRGSLSRADLWALSALVAAEESLPATSSSLAEGAGTIMFKMDWIGRIDCEHDDEYYEDEYYADYDDEFDGTGGPHRTLPGPDMHTHELFDWFHNEFKFDEWETIALMGAHTLGAASRINSGFDGENGWVFNKQTLDNEYYRLLLHEDWIHVEIDNSDVIIPFGGDDIGGGGGSHEKNIMPTRWQWNREPGGLMMLNSDIALARDFEDYLDISTGEVMCDFADDGDIESGINMSGGAQQEQGFPQAQVQQQDRRFRSSSSSPKQVIQPRGNTGRTFHGINSRTYPIVKNLGEQHLPPCPHASQMVMDIVDNYATFNEEWLHDFHHVFTKLLRHGYDDGGECNEPPCILIPI